MLELALAKLSLRKCAAQVFYYPQDTVAELGPTEILPCTQYVCFSSLLSARSLLTTAVRR